MHGVLIIPLIKQDIALSTLTSARKGYQGRIHFVELRDNTENPKAIIASEWVKTYFCDISSYGFYKCMIVDRQSPAFDESRYLKPFHLYNYFAMLSVFGGVTWSLNNFDEVELSIYSEDMTRTSEDNFISYLPRELITRAEKRKNPRPRIVLPNKKVILVNGDPRKVNMNLSTHCEFIQLTDIITGGISQAINARASQDAKLSLGRTISEWIKDTRLPPWLQTKDLHRIFSISCFLNGIGGFYNVNLEIENKDQLKFNF